MGTAWHENCVIISLLLLSVVVVRTSHNHNDIISMVCFYLMYCFQLCVVLLQVSVHMPAEFTTMAGRRLREAVYKTVKKDWGKDVLVRREGRRKGTTA